MAWIDWKSTEVRPTHELLPDGNYKLGVKFYDQPGSVKAAITSLELCHVIKRGDGTSWRSPIITSPYETIVSKADVGNSDVGHTIDVTYYLDPVKVVPGTMHETANAIIV